MLAVPPPLMAQPGPALPSWLGTYVGAEQDSVGGWLGARVGGHWEGLGVARQVH